MKNSQTIQGVLSILALICLAVGWFDVFSPEITELLYHIFLPFDRFKFRISGAILP